LLFCGRLNASGTALQFAITLFDAPRNDKKIIAPPLTQSFLHASFQKLPSAFNDIAIHCSSPALRRNHLIQYQQNSNQRFIAAILRGHLEQPSCATNGMLFAV